MRQRRFLLLLFMLSIAGVKTVFSQKTFLYKRVMIVKNGAKTNKNDDAHYITFTDKGCYESDKDGFTTNNGFIKFTKNENNLHCYYGNCSFGSAHYYFSNDYSRLNVRLDNNTTYVYQRELSGKTTASRRAARSNSNSGGGVYVAPPPVINNGGSYGGGGNSGGSSSHRSTSISCSSCNGTGICSGCGGKRGSWQNTGYYTGSGSESWISCGSCRGSGRCGVCRGTGKIR